MAGRGLRWQRVRAHQIGQIEKRMQEQFVSRGVQAVGVQAVAAHIGSSEATVVQPHVQPLARVRLHGSSINFLCRGSVQPRGGCRASLRLCRPSRAAFDHTKCLSASLQPVHAQMDALKSTSASSSMINDLLILVSVGETSKDLSKDSSDWRRPTTICISPRCTKAAKADLNCRPR